MLCGVAGLEDAYNENNEDFDWYTLMANGRSLSCPDNIGPSSYVII